MLISVCMATYNGEPYIKEQVNSILAQELEEGQQMEIIVSDDNSTDHTVEVLESYHDDRIKIYRHEPHRRYKHYNALMSASKNFENAVLHASGDVIFLSDQDDVWYPSKIKTMLQYCGGGKLLICGFEWMSNDGNITGATAFSKPAGWLSLMRRSAYYGFSMAMDASLARRLFPMPMLPQHDYYMTLVAMKLGKLEVIPDLLCAHRYYPQQTSNSGFSESVFWKIVFRIKTLFYSLIVK